MDTGLQARLKREPVVWLVTAGSDCRPQAVPVWFLWDGKSFLIYGQPGVKVRHVRANPNVELHLNTDETGNVVVRMSGYATISKSQPPAHKVPAFIRKYRSDLKGFGWTPEEFSRRYPFPIRVRRLRFH
jgi:PPOX class probable F420-dependent enzyme